MSLNPLPLLYRLLEAVYGVYALLLFLMFGSATLILVTLVPGLNIKARRSIAHFTARSFFAVAGIRIRVLGAEELPDEPCVVVANHASYLDGVVLKGMLPARFSFVIKKEVSRVPLAGLLLRRIGAEFVDRFNRHAGGMDARRLIKAADSGQALAFFPEGTFVAQPGLGKFHTGAFAIAARSKLPVVPLAIRGTRHILPSGHFLPRPGRIEICILPAVRAPADLDSTATITMTRDVARARILAALNEPDLGESDGLADLQTPRKG
ncbi:lysophospholipid acyltransferase family protein [Povalibacter sp.]|uniref:lysophospholipid acyltransferase family protein n=1 Tax=Povalibacter sp. TaxID=1962978 RepID=UPI002F3ECFB1